LKIKFIDFRSAGRNL